MRRLNIVHVCPFFDPATRYGGPAAQLQTVCCALAERGHVVRVVTTDLGVSADVRREWWTERDGYRVWYARAGLLGRTAPYFAPRARVALERAVEPADAIHLHLSFTHLNVLARRAAFARHVPYVYAPRSGIDPERLRERRIAKQAFLALFEHRLIRDAACLHALSEAERGQLVRRGAPAGRVMIVPNAAPPPARDAHVPDGERFRRLIGIPRDAAVVLYLGRLERTKGLDLLVEGFARALARAPRGRHDAHLVVAGPDDGERARIESIARRRGVTATVHFTGHLDGEMHRGALAAADVLALTSSEGLSNDVLEALGAGRCVLVTEACHLPEIATAGAGVVVRAEIDDVAAGLGHLLANPALRSEMGRRGARLVRERFSIDRVIDALEAMYERAASSGESSREQQAPSRAA